MKFKFFTLTIIFSLFASIATAEMIVINGRYTVAKDSVRGYFYRQSNKQTVFDVRWSDWSTQYKCQDIYDDAKVMAASLNLAIQIGEARSLDFKEYLASQGFEGCSKF